jgi:hypothetical protein
MRRHHLLSIHAFFREVRVHFHNVRIVKRRPSRCTHKLFHIAMSSITKISKLTRSYWALLVEIASLGWRCWHRRTFFHRNHRRIKKFWLIIRNLVKRIQFRISFISISSYNQFLKLTWLESFIKISLIRYSDNFRRFI